MGQMRFTAPHPERITPFVLQRAYIAGIDSIPWLSTTDWDGSTLTVSREIRESGNLHIPWPVAGHGELMLSTASLMERRSPYLLPLELARGTLNRIRNQCAYWQFHGLNLTETSNHQLNLAAQEFAIAATAQADVHRAAEAAERALTFSLDAVRMLVDEFTSQFFAARAQQGPQTSKLLAGNIGYRVMDERATRRVLRAFNSVVVPAHWRSIELDQGRFDFQAAERQLQFCRDQGLRVIGGPLLDLSRANLPDWMSLWAGDYEMAQPSIMKFMQATVEKLRGQVHVWNVAGGINVADALQLNEEHRLRLTVDVIELVRKLDGKVPMLVTFDQPFAEYLAHADYELSPLQFADTIVRAELGVAGLGLTFNLGYWPDGTTERDLIELNRLLDQWGALGLPLVIFLTAPNCDEVDPLAAAGLRTIPEAVAGGHSRESQAEFVNRTLPLLLAKPMVHAVVWNQLFDDQPHVYPYGGLFDFRGKKKRAIRAISALRRQYLN
ncbi:MAG: hypothetical protein FJ295_17160 [Planctomycetes bacterium]|nr:hypothetical protein [Planctomycetota bacterium]